MVAKMAEEMGVRKVAGQQMPPRATSAAESALRLRPRRALSSAQPSAYSGRNEHSASRMTVISVCPAHRVHFARPSGPSWSRTVPHGWHNTRGCHRAMHPKWVSR